MVVLFPPPASQLYLLFSTVYKNHVQIYDEGLYTGIKCIEI